MGSGGSDRETRCVWRRVGSNMAPYNTAPYSLQHRQCFRTWQMHQRRPYQEQIPSQVHCGSYLFRPPYTVRGGSLRSGALSATRPLGSLSAPARPLRGTETPRTRNNQKGGRKQSESGDSSIDTQYMTVHFELSPKLRRGFALPATSLD